MTYTVSSGTLNLTQPNDIPQVAIYQIVTFFRGEQGAVKFNNLVVAYWLNILCKHGGVSKGVIAINTTLSHTVAYLHFHLPEFIDLEKWPANSQYFSAVDFSVWGALKQALYR